MKKAVLFLCLGNICRSPMAEAVFRQLIQEKNLEEQFLIDSAGTSGWHDGERAHKGTIEKLAQHKISMEQFVSRKLIIEDGQKFDYIVCMDSSNVDNAKSLLKNSKAQIIRFLDLTPYKKDVPDPYYTGDFEETYQLCVLGCEALLKHIQES